MTTYRSSGSIVPGGPMSNDKPYARCQAEECNGLLLDTKDDASEHMKVTYSQEKGVSHRLAIINPTREQIVQRMVDRAVESAIEKFCEDLDYDVRKGRISSEEVTESLRSYSDFLDGWKEWIQEEA